MKNVKCARCVRCGKEYEAVPNLTNCSCGGILDIVYDYDYIKAHFTKETLKNRVNPTMWRYRELLPVEDTTPDTPLRVGWSPLYEEPKLAEMLGLGRLWVKDDGINPTASLKDRASAMAVAKAHEAGAKIIACSSTGNAASSLAGNAAAAGFKTYIFVPERAPKGKVAQLMIFGANVISVKGNYEETFKMSAEAIEKWGWYNRNAAINPYLSEGKKTVSLEIAEQLNWEMPDYLAISVGDGCTIAGVWNPGVTVAEVRSKCRRIQAIHGLDVVIIDYLQLMQSAKSQDSRVLEISAMTRALKILARELNVAVVVLSQLSREPDKRKDHTPLMSDLRESGSIEQDADVIMMLYRPAAYPDTQEAMDGDNTSYINVAKHRNGATASIKVMWVPELTKYANYAPDPD